MLKKGDNNITVTVMGAGGGSSGFVGRGGGGSSKGKRADTLIMDDIGESIWPKKLFGGNTMKFAPVAPYHIYQMFLMGQYFPKTVLLLAHDVVKHPTEYEETFKHPGWNDTTIIMDNSLVETGGAVDAEMVFEAAELVSADIVVLPDVMGKAMESADATIEAWNSWNWKFREYEMMVVIHGTSDAEWFAAAETIREAGIKPNWLSIPRKCEDGTNRRWRLVNWAQMIFGPVRQHLLGFSDFVASDLVAASNPIVQSIDSAVPLRLTSNHLLSEDAGPRGDWWETVEFKPWMIDRCKLVDQYINNAQR